MMSSPVGRLRIQRTRRELDNVFEQQAVRRSDGSRVCPLCQAVAIRRSQYNRSSEGGWVAVTSHPSRKPRVICQVCRSEEDLSRGKHRKSRIAKDRMAIQARRSLRVRPSVRTSRSNAWTPQSEVPSAERAIQSRAAGGRGRTGNRNLQLVVVEAQRATSTRQPERRNRSREWTPGMIEKRTNRITKVKFSLTAADRVRRKARQVRSEYQAGLAGGSNDHSGSMHRSTEKRYHG